MLRYSRQWKHLICKYYTFIKNNTFNTTNANRLLSYLLCAKVSVSLYWCQIVHFLIMVPNCPFAFLVPNCPVGAILSGAKLSYHKWLISVEPELPTTWANGALNLEERGHLLPLVRVEGLPQIMLQGFNRNFFDLAQWYRVPPIFSTEMKTEL